MKYTPKIEKAFIRAAQVHRHMLRKADGNPFIVHPIAVACILSEYTDDEDIICAGILHDTIEDSREEPEPYTFEQMEAEFGHRVTHLVQGVTEDDLPGSKQETWQIRKERYLEHLGKADEATLMVSCADKIHNLRSMVQAHIQFGESVWEKFNNPPEKKLWFFGEVLRVLKNRLDNPIVMELDRAYQQALSLFR